MQVDGTYHLTIEMTPEGVRVAQSDCPGGDCVRTGTITRAGQSIVCLPEQVVVQLTGASADGRTLFSDRGAVRMKITTRRLALCAVLTALALGLSTLEGMFPVSLLIPLPGIKLGLANIVTVYALYALGPASALAILLARCLLGAMFAGNASALLFSLMGGVLSMLVMIVLRHLPGLSIYGVSIGGAAAHNIGQIGAAMIVLGGTAVLGYRRCCWRCHF